MVLDLVLPNDLKRLGHLLRRGRWLWLRGQRERTEEEQGDAEHVEDDKEAAHDTSPLCGEDGELAERTRRVQLEQAAAEARIEQEQGEHDRANEPILEEPMPAFAHVRLVDFVGFRTAPLLATFPADEPTARSTACERRGHRGEEDHLRVDEIGQREHGGANRVQVEEIEIEDGEPTRDRISSRRPTRRQAVFKGTHYLWVGEKEDQWAGGRDSEPG
eukprot:1115515-Prymnesium_polylepis.12